MIMMPSRTRSDATIASTSSINKPIAIPKPKPKPKTKSKRLHEPYTLTLSSKDYRNLVIYGPESHPLYHIETRVCSQSKTERTLVFQQDDPEGRQIYPIACLDFYVDGNGGNDWRREDMMAYNGERVPLAIYLPRNSTTHLRYMSTPSGEWTWGRCFGGLKLRTSSSQNYIAKYHRKIFSSSKPTIEISEYDNDNDNDDNDEEADSRGDISALRYLDLIVIGWIVSLRDLEMDQASGSALRNANGNA